MRSSNSRNLASVDCSRAPLWSLHAKLENLGLLSKSFNIRHSLHELPSPPWSAVQEPPCPPWSAVQASKSALVCCLRACPSAVQELPRSPLLVDGVVGLANRLNQGLGLRFVKPHTHQCFYGLVRVNAHAYSLSTLVRTLPNRLPKTELRQALCAATVCVHYTHHSGNT